MLDSWKKNELVNPGFNYGTEDDYHLRFSLPVNWKLFAMPRILMLNSRIIVHGLNFPI